MLVVHPHYVSGGSGGSNTIALASPTCVQGSVYNFPTYSPYLPHRATTFSTARPGDVAELRVTSTTTADETSSNGDPQHGAVTSASASSPKPRAGRMFGHYDRTSFLSPRQERARPTGPDFRGLYHRRRVGLVSPPAASTPVKLQLDKFPIWGQLRRSRTDLRASLPSNQEIVTANEEIVFFAHRRGYTRQQGFTSHGSRPVPQEVPSNLAALETGQPHHDLADTATEAGHQLTVNRASPINSTDTIQAPMKTSTPKNVSYAPIGGLPRNSSAKSTKSSPAELPRICDPNEPVATRSEKICQMRANLMPEVAFAADGQVESGLYQATFKQAPGVIANDRRNDVFLRFGGTDWKTNNKPVIYSNLFLPRVTCKPKTIGVRFRTDIDLVRAGKLTP